MPNPESPIRRCTATFVSEGAKQCHGTKEGVSVGELKGKPGCPIGSRSLSKFYEDKEKFSCPNVLEIINKEFRYGDRKFPAIRASLGACESLGKLDIEWKRPHEITTKKPKFFVNRASPYDIVQGRLKNSGFLAAVASLTVKDELFQKVVPRDQSFEQNYAGIFRFRFWQYGKWVDVVVDDDLPTYRTKDGKTRLFGTQPTAEDTFWLPLLEKAYAKLHGSYHAIEGSVNPTGRSGDAMEDFTGGISDYYTREFKGAQSEALDFHKISKKALKNEALVTCYIEDSVMSGSKVTGSHFYSVKDSDKNSEVKLVKIRRPDEGNLDMSEPKASEVTMTEKDFNEKCASVEICHLNLKEFDPDSAKKKWQLCEIDGKWSKESAGGPDRSPQFPTMEYNPRYCFKLEEKGNVIISLMRKHPSKNDPKSQDPFAVGFQIYKVKCPETTVIRYPLHDDFFHIETKEVRFERYGDNTRLTQATIAKWKSDQTPGYKTELAPDCMQHQQYFRESNCRLNLDSGHYCLVVYNKEPTAGDFFLRIFSDNSITLKQEETPWVKRPVISFSNGVAHCKTPKTE